MSYSSAETIASTIINNQSLECLDLSECGFVDFRLIETSLCQNHKLKSLILNSNAIFQNMMSIEATDSVEDNSSCLQYLDLSNCDLSELQVTTVAK